MGIILPKTETSKNEEEVVINYEATIDDEEKFILMYHMNMSLSDVDGLDQDRRKWIVARFMAQKNMENEVRERHRLMSQIAPNLKT